MNILIFSHFYKLDGVIGAVRWTSFAKRLSKHHNVFVVTNDASKSGVVEKDGNITVIYQDDECPYVKRGSLKRENNTLNKKKELRKVNEATQKRNIKKIIKDYAKITLYMHSMKSTAKNNIEKLNEYLKKENITIDYVISTSRPFIAGFNAYYLVKKTKSKWLFDQRDLPFSYTDRNKTDEKAYKYYFKKFEKHITKYTLVSKGMAESFLDLMGNEIREKVIVLYNGYNSGDLSLIDNNCPKEKIVFSYVGDLYEGMRDVRILFDALHIVSEKVIEFDINDFRFEYAGGDSYSLFVNAEKYGFETIINDNGKVSHSKAIRIQQESDFVLLLTWNTEDYKGILPGKFYECMLVKKPVICITSGNVPFGEADQMVSEMNLGIAVDYVNYEDSVDRLANYLIEQYSRFKENKPMLFKPQSEKVYEFDYDNLTQKLEEILVK